MTTLIFYENPIPLHREQHRTTRLKTLAQGYSYAAPCNSFPLVVTEFAAACREYPIVFTLDGVDSGMPIILVGLRNDENLFVDARRRVASELYSGFPSAAIRSYYMKPATTATSP